MKKFLLLFSALSLFANVSSAAVGDTFDIEGVTYIVKSDDTAGIKKVQSSLTSVTLPEKVTNEGAEYSVVSVEDYALYYSNATSVKVPATVKSLGYYCFGSSSIANVTLPEGLESIGDYAFYGCRSLTSIDIPDNVTELGPSAGSVFGTCYALESIKLPKGLTYICKSAFYNCKNLKSVVIPENVTEIRRVAFNRCGSLESVTIPESVTSIGDGAFGDCKSLATINGSMNNVATIGEEAFFNTAITEFAIPDKLESIGTRAFTGSQISKVTIGDNKNFKIYGEGVYAADLSMLVFFLPKSTATEVTVQDGCKGIYGGAFQLTGVKKVVLPESVIAIDEFAFCQTPLESINLSDNIVLIGEQAFASTKLTSVKLPQGLRHIADATFAGCTDLTSVTVGSNVLDMGIRQFYQATALKEIHFTGSKVPTVGYWEYTSESPFYGVPDKQVTVYCPKGLADSYISEYGSFEAISQIVDSEAGIITPAVDPADNANVSTLDKLTLTFADDVTVVSRNPKIKVLCGKLISQIPVGQEISVGMWSVIGSDKKAPQIVPLDEYGEGGEPINMEKDKEYFVIIPAGTFKNAEGYQNEEITLHYYGTYVEPQFMPVTVDPADGSSINEIGNVYLTFESNVSKSYSAESKVKVIEGSLQDGVPVGTETMGSADQWFVITSGNKAQIFPADYDGFITPIKLEADKDYFFIVEAGAFRPTSEYVYNKQIVVHYSNREGGVSLVETAGIYAVKSADAVTVYVGENAANVAVYSAAGSLVKSATNVNGEITFDGFAKGLYIINVKAGKTIKSIKVVM